jgi:membrane protein implicated in regulation of membrane protease activity
MAWWMWLVAGFGLMALELVTPSGFFIMFFGVAALVVGLLGGAGLVMAPWAQWLVFTVSAVASLMLFRRKFQSHVELSGARPPVDSLVGEIAFPVDLIAPGAVGRVALRGSNWEARNESDIALAANQRCRVTRISGLQLGVVAE